MSVGDTRVATSFVDVFADGSGADSVPEQDTSRTARSVNVRTLTVNLNLGGR
jgi:hypothetical protein